jgi:hypothetical protein
MCRGPGADARGIDGRVTVAAGRAGKGRTSAQERERARLYEARRRFHESVIQRRRRDNVIAGVAGGALVLAILGGQIAYYTLGPGTPAPAPSPTTTPDPTPTTTPTPAPNASPEPTPSPTP